MMAQLHESCDLGSAPVDVNIGLPQHLLIRACDEGLAQRLIYMTGKARVKGASQPVSF